jgi:hypothetical protein
MCLSHVFLGIPSLLPLGFVIKILYAHIISPTHAMCHTHLIFPNWWKSFFHELYIQMGGMSHFRNPWSQTNECIRKFIKKKSMSSSCKIFEWLIEEALCTKHYFWNLVVGSYDEMHIPSYHCYTDYHGVTSSVISFKLLNFDYENWSCG